MPPPITPALLEPRGVSSGGAAETEPPTWRRGAGSRLDFDGIAGTIATIVGATIVGHVLRDTGEDDLMEPDDVEVSGVNGERFEDLREAARLLGRRAAMEGLSTGSAVLSTSPPDSSGSGGRNEPPVCSPPLPQDITLHGGNGPPARRGVHVRRLGAPLPGVVGDSGVGSADQSGGAGGGAASRERERGGA